MKMKKNAKRNGTKQNGNENLDTCDLSKKYIGPSVRIFETVTMAYEDATTVVPDSSIFTFHLPRVTTRIAQARTHARDDGAVPSQNPPPLVMNRRLPLPVPRCMHAIVR
jgi:hypothetical protein